MSKVGILTLKHIPVAIYFLYPLLSVFNYNYDMYEVHSYKNIVIITLEW